MNDIFYLINSLFIPLILGFNLLSIFFRKQKEVQDLRVWMRCEAQPRSEARRTNLYVERAPEVATKQIAKRVSPLDLILKLSLGYSLGTGIIALWMFTLGLNGLPLNYQTITLPLILCCILLTFINLYLKNGLQTNDQSHTGCSSNSLSTSKFCLNPLTGLMMFLLVIFIVINMLQIFWRAMNIPIYAYDAIATVAFKAKIFFYEEQLPPLTKLPHQTYPLLVPFTLTWTAINLGAWSDQLVQITFPCLCLSFLIIF